MNNATKRMEGTAEELGGKLKAGLGKAIGNEQMEAEGRAKELKGHGKKEAAKAAERTKGKLEEVAGSLKKKAGDALDNEQMELEGRAQALKGQARQQSNR